MGAFMLAGVIFALTLGTCALVIMGDMMSDGRSTGIFCNAILPGGTGTAGLVLASRWMPAIGW